MKDLLERYTIAVQQPEVSGFEHLDMLMMRDRLADQVDSMSTSERKRLAEADHALVSRSAEFYAALSEITSLEHERQERQPPPTHWWFLDVLASVPLSILST